MSTVLVTAIGSYAGELVIVSLKRLGYQVIGCDIFPKEWIVCSKDVDKFYQVSKSADTNRFLEEIDAICEKEKITEIIPLTDVEIDFFCQYKDYYDNKKIKVLISDVESVKICRNKWKMDEYIRTKAIPLHLIPTVLAEKYDGISFGFPCICKPINGRSSQGQFVVRHASDWEYFCKEKDLSNYIVQKMIVGVVVAIDVIRDYFDNVVVVPRKELLRTKNGAGTSVEVFDDAALTEQCKCLAKSLKLTGCVCFEFILDNEGCYYFLECNARFAGGSKFTLLAGYDCVYNHMRAFRGERIKDFKLENSMIISRRYTEYIMRQEACNA